MIHELKEEIVKDMSFDIYNKIPAFRSSGINDLLIPKKYWYKNISGLSKEVDPKHFVMGSAVHTLLLEPDKFVSKYIVYPDKIDRRTKEGKIIYQEFLNLSDGKNVLDVDEFSSIKSMVDSMQSHKLYMPLFCKYPDKNIEHSLFWRFGQVWIKSRPDFYNDHVTVDIKTTSCVTQEEFFREAFNYGYHRQAALQIDGLFVLTGKIRHHILFVVEKSPPYLSYMCSFSDEAIKIARKEYTEAHSIYENCMKSNVWKGYDDHVTEITIPSWHREKFQSNGVI